MKMGTYFMIACLAAAFLLGYFLVPSPLAWRWKSLILQVYFFSVSWWWIYFQAQWIRALFEKQDGSRAIRERLRYYCRPGQGLSMPWLGKRYHK